MRIIEYIICVLLLTALIFLAETCDRMKELTDRDKIISLYTENAEVFRKAVETGDYDEVKALDGIQNVTELDDRIEFYCGGTGFGSETSYYGILYTEDDILNTWHRDGYYVDIEDGDIVFYEGGRGDNVLRYAPIEDGFYYFAESF